MVKNFLYIVIIQRLPRNMTFELVFGKIPPVLDFTKDLNIASLYNIDSYETDVKFRLQVAHSRAASFVENVKLSRKKVSSDHANPVNFSLNATVHNLFINK